MHNSPEGPMTRFALEPAGTARNLQGRVALVTGAGHGIGLAIAAKLGAAGASVVVNDLTQDVADGAVAAVEAAGAVRYAARATSQPVSSPRVLSRPPSTASACWTSWSTTRGMRRTPRPSTCRIGSGRRCSTSC